VDELQVIIDMHKIDKQRQRLKATLFFNFYVYGNYIRIRFIHLVTIFGVI